MMKIYLFLISLLAVTQVYSQKYLNQLETPEDFKKFSGLPLSDKYGEVSALKVVYDIRSKKLYYINSKYYKYHHEFCSSQIDQNIVLENFNRINYSNQKNRRYLLANINYFKALDIYALELSTLDLMPIEKITLLSRLISESSYIGKNLHILLNNSRLQQSKKELIQSNMVLDPSEVYQNLNYQAIGKFSSDGILRFITNYDQENNSIKPQDIIVLNETPLVLPNASGIIVTQFQTPLSHLSILAQNRKIPIFAYKKAFQDSILLKLKDSAVRLTVKKNNYKIVPVKKIKPTKNNKKNIKIKANLTVDTLVGIHYVNRRSYKYTGNKATNFGTLYRLSKKHNFKVPENAFVIPFYFYNQHVTSSNAKILIDSLNHIKYKGNSLATKRLLQNIRKKIKNQPIDSILLQKVSHKIAKSNFTRFRFRSSTNAEDAKGFSGAGLYSSKTGILHSTKKPIDKAIKKVWASLWSYQAYSEREYFNLNHQEVYMGILVHRSFPTEDVNGVAITKNLYRPDNFGFVINAQLGNESVVNPTPNIICDQFICYPNKNRSLYNDRTIVDIITKSSLNNNKLVMTENEIQQLANQLAVIKKYFINHTFTSKSYFAYALDIEFKLDGPDRNLYIKQVRPYND